MENKNKEKVVEMRKRAKIRAIFWTLYVFVALSFAIVSFTVMYKIDCFVVFIIFAILIIYTIIMGRILYKAAYYEELKKKKELP